MTLEAEDPRNLADLREYVQTALRTERMTQVLPRSAPGYSTDQLVEVLLRKTAGVWVYLHHVLAELEQAQDPVDLEALPKTLWDYYKRFWQSWKRTHSTTWRQMHLPFLATLAAVQEPATLRLLGTLAGTGDSFELPDRWRPFLTSEGKGAERRYRLYHASLRDFMGGDIPEETVGEVDQVFAEELKQATLEAHSRIAQRYLDAWGDVGAGLPGLSDPARRDLDGGYGWRRIAMHLAASGRSQDLHSLLAAEEVPPVSGGIPRHPKNRWLEAHDQANDLAGYLSDVAQAWELAENADDQRVQAGGLGEGIGLEVLYALLTSSVRSRVYNVDPSLVVALVTTGIRSPAWGMAYAAQMRGLQRAEALAGLAPHLPEEKRREVLADAVAAAREIGDQDWRAEALAAIAPHVPEALLADVLATAREIRDEGLRAWALAAIPPACRRGCWPMPWPQPGRSGTRACGPRP